MNQQDVVKAEPVKADWEQKHSHEHLSQQDHGRGNHAVGGDGEPPPQDHRRPSFASIPIQTHAQDMPIQAFGLKSALSGLVGIKKFRRIRGDGAYIKKMATGGSQQEREKRDKLDAENAEAMHNRYRMEAEGHEQDKQEHKERLERIKHKHKLIAKLKAAGELSNFDDDEEPSWDDLREAHKHMVYGDMYTIAKFGKKAFGAIADRWHRRKHAKNKSQSEEEEGIELQEMNHGGEGPKPDDGQKEEQPAPKDMPKPKAGDHAGPHEDEDDVHDHDHEEPEEHEDRAKAGGDGGDEAELQELAQYNQSAQEKLQEQNEIIVNLQSKNRERDNHHDGDGEDDP